MIAEIKHKVKSTQEDELTGNFFGNMRYLPYSRGLKKIFDAYAQSPKDEMFKSILLGLDAEEFSFRFWERSQLGLGEIDAFMEVDGAAIGIEVKLYSGLSTEDQLRQEVKMLQEFHADGSRLLLFVAPKDSVQEAYDSNYKYAREHGVHLGYLSWEDILQGLDEVITVTPFEQLIISDLKDLLVEKGFDVFRGFDVHVEVEEGKYYDFGGKYS